MNRLLKPALLCAFAALATPGAARAWGYAGHTIINTVAASELAHDDVPAFLRTTGAQFAIAYFGPLPDRLKGSGAAWDADYDPGHFVDLSDDARVEGAVALDDLPPTREAYDSALRSAGSDQYKAGYLPYAIAEDYEQLRMDFAYWRVDAYAASHARNAALRAREAQIARLEEMQVVADVGTWGHYVGDAAQPLHVSVHFNGWGNFPNPNGYTQSRHTHAFFESDFVNRYMSVPLVQRRVQLQRVAMLAQLVAQPEIMHDIAAYLSASLAAVPQLYSIEKAGGFDVGSQTAIDFTAMRLAAGADELRALTLLAWRDSMHARVGFPATGVQDVLSGRAAWPQTPE